MEIVLSGDFLKKSFHEEINEEDPLKCMPNGDYTTQWKLLKGKILNSLYAYTINIRLKVTEKITTLLQCYN